MELLRCKKGVRRPSRIYCKLSGTKLKNLVRGALSLICLNAGRFDLKSVYGKKVLGSYYM